MDLEYGGVSEKKPNKSRCCAEIQSTPDFVVSKNAQDGFLGIFQNIMPHIDKCMRGYRWEGGGMDLGIRVKQIWEKIRTMLNYSRFTQVPVE